MTRHTKNHSEKARNSYIFAAVVTFALAALNIVLGLDGVGFDWINLTVGLILVPVFIFDAYQAWKWLKIARKEKMLRLYSEASSEDPF